MLTGPSRGSSRWIAAARVKEKSREPSVPHVWHSVTVTLAGSVPGAPVAKIT